MNGAHLIVKQCLFIVPIISPRCWFMLGCLDYLEKNSKALKKSRTFQFFLSRWKVMSSSSFPGSGSSLETSVQIWCKVWNEFSLGGDDEVVVQQPKVQSILQLLLSKAQRTNERTNEQRQRQKSWKTWKMCPNWSSWKTSSSSSKMRFPLVYPSSHLSCSIWVLLFI